MHDLLVSGHSRAFAKTLECADEYAKSPWPIFLMGETGVGKELVARRIHSHSAASCAAFVPLNCGAIPPTLFESELFGYERGAFSGATQGRPGLIRAASGGTLFLDEIGELDASSQVKLLRWLDSGEIRSLGSTRIEKAPARLVAATHVDMARAVARGAFRLDLFERLSVLALRVPPLRERREDICVLAQTWLEQYGARFRASDLFLLEQAPWPGNVRQLRNVVLRAIARGRGNVTARLLAELLREENLFTMALGTGADLPDTDSPLADIEKRVILDRVRRCHGNKKQAAKELGIAKSTLHEKFRKWNQSAVLELESSSALGRP